MLDNSFSKLKNGSDIRGLASGSRIELTNEVVEKICHAFVRWLSDRYKISPEEITVAVGHDSRVSASRLKNVVINTIRSFGCNIYDCSLCSTPAMFMAISAIKCTASIEITASHLPPEKNGLKFFTSDGGLAPEDIENILNLAQRVPETLPQKSGSVRKMNLMGYYSEKLRNVIKEALGGNSDKPLKGMKIVIDAGNGAGGFFEKEVLKPLGADTEGSVGIEPDGNFPLHVPNPENAEALKSISEITVSSSADLGIIFDTDVDRAAIVDSDGKVISGTKLIALVADDILKNNSKAVIVTDSMTYESLKDFISKRGGYQFRYKRGYNNVISMAKKINEKGGNCLLAIETSGHAAFMENDFIDDGAYLACKMIIQSVRAKNEMKKLSSKLDDFVVPVGVSDTRLEIKDENADVNKLLKDLKNLAKSNKNLELDEDNVEGVRIHFPSKQHSGWLLVRESLHDPVVIIHAESYVDGGLRAMMSFIKPFLRKYSFLDVKDL